MNSKFNKQELAYVKANRLQLSSKEMAHHVGMSKSLFGVCLNNHGLRLTKKEIGIKRGNIMKGKTSFTDSEDAFIKANYLSMPIKAIGKKLRRSYCGVMGRLDAMELKVPSEVILKHKQQTRYQKGFEPFNKGKKQTEFMSQEAIERTKKNRFKKGHKPHNTNVVGAESIHTDKSGRQYLLVKIADSNWKLKSREVYKEHFGPIQENELVTYKDGNSLNCEPENLTLITKAENALKNRGHHFPAELKAAINALNQLNKTLKIKDNGKK